MILKWFSPAGTEIVFSKDSTDYKLLKSYSGLSEAPINHLTRQGVYQDGLTRIDSHFVPRQVSFDVMVMAPTLNDLQIALQYLVISLNPLAGEGSLIYTREDGTEYVLNCIGNSKVVGPSTATRTSTMQLVTIDLIGFDPFWHSYPNTMTYFTAGTALVYPYAYDYTYSIGTPAQTIINAGNIASEVTIIISGEVVNPVITRVYTDAFGVATTEALTFLLSMAVGEVLTVTTGYGNKTIRFMHDDGTYDTNPFQYLVAGSKFWQLVPGDNVVTVSNTSITVSTTTSIESASKFSGV